MDSMAEEALFKEYGWKRDVIALVWRAPDGYEVSDEDLVVASSVLPERQFKDRLGFTIVSHGRKVR